jgi:peptidoglycan glycosyltransferase
VNRPIRRLAVGVFAAFSLLLASVTWTQVVHADALKTHPLNPRPALSEKGKERGLIITADGTVVAQSIEDPDDPLAFVRIYPDGEAFAHTVGFNSVLVGSSGLEAAYSQELRSRRDVTISDLIAVILGQDLGPQSLQMTVDADLQRAALRALGGQTGAVVAIDPLTGAILASVSSPSFDPESLGGDDATAVWDELLIARGEPLHDRATKELQAPGSTFKTIVTAAALDTGTAGPGTQFADPVEFELPESTATISNFDGRVCNDGNSVTLLRAFTRSCNTVFADLSIQTSAEDIGITTDALGWNTDVDFEWPIPIAVFKTVELARDPAALAQSGIGERDVRATPLHMALVAATVANQGVAPKPFLVQRVFDADGETLVTTEARSLGRAMSPATATVLSQLMERVVTEGTGRSAAVPSVRVAGKTGTAEGSGDGPHAWFIGFAPVENPEIAIAVLIEGGGDTGESATGGTIAAPIASELLELWLTGSS